jgi:hypothetical protein
MFSTLTPRVQTAGHPASSGHRNANRPGSQNGNRAGCDLRASDHADSVSLLSSVALRNLELHSLALFK